MNYFLKTMKTTGATLLLLLGHVAAKAADATAAPAAAANTDFTISVNDVLIGCALLLLLIAVILGNTLRAAIKYYHEKNIAESRRNSSGSQTIKSLLFLVGCMLAASYPALAQDAAGSAGPSSIPESVVVRWILYMVIAIELIVIVFFARWIRLMTGIDVQRKASAPERKFNFTKFWERINRFKPIEEEADLDTGHSYDGIRELNNVTPPWFIAAFVLTIVVGMGYLWRYHVAKSAPLQIEEYNNEVAEAKIRQAEFLKTQANNVDENTVKMLGANDIAAGQALYTANCVACHGAHGQGGVGPNLTDDYWLHKGGVKHVFYSIKYGWTDKGMKSWKEDFSPNQIAQIASYVVSLKGTKPENPKEPQGDIYKDEEGGAPAAADTTQAATAATGK
jgi:cytochrome c oxidase cbb3-type subunit 3